MKIVKRHCFRIFSVFLTMVFCVHPVLSQESEEMKIIDQKVQAFFENHRFGWRDMNVPASDGKILYDIIVKK